MRITVHDRWHAWLGPLGCQGLLSYMWPAQGACPPPCQPHLPPAHAAPQVSVGPGVHEGRPLSVKEKLEVGAVRVEGGVWGAGVGDARRPKSRGSTGEELFSFCGMALRTAHTPAFSTR